MSAKLSTVPPPTHGLSQDQYEKLDDLQRRIVLRSALIESLLETTSLELSHFCAEGWTVREAIQDLNGDITNAAGEIAKILKRAVEDGAPQ